jgi:hypothetical protein
MPAMSRHGRGGVRVIERGVLLFLNAVEGSA